MLENTKGTIQRNLQHRLYQTKKIKTKTQHNICWTPLKKTNTNNVNKTSALPIQTTGGRDEPNTMYCF